MSVIRTQFRVDEECRDIAQRLEFRCGSHASPGGRWDKAVPPVSSILRWLYCSSLVYNQVAFLPVGVTLLTVNLTQPKRQGRDSQWDIVQMLACGHASWNCLVYMLINVGRPSPLWTTPFPVLGS